MRKPMSEWGPGPWTGEPENNVDWTDDATGYLCAARRNNSGAWCGYVRLPQDHPLHGVDYNADLPERLTGAAESVMSGTIGKRGPMNLFALALGGKTHPGDLFDVHGSITYSGTEWPAEGYWYGFDCSHAGDVSPAYDYLMRCDPESVYRTLDYTKAECVSLARQLQALVVPFPA